MTIIDEDSCEKIQVIIDEYINEDLSYNIYISFENDVFSYSNEDGLVKEEELEILCKYIRKSLKNKLDGKINFKFMLSNIEFELENIEEYNTNLVVNFNNIVSYSYYLESENLEKLVNYIESVLKGSVIDEI